MIDMLFGKKEIEKKPKNNQNDELRDLYLVEVQQIVTETIEDHFGSSVVVFPTFFWEEGNLNADFVAYRSFALRVQIIFKTDQHTEKGMLNIMVGVGPLWQDLSGLLETELRAQVRNDFTKENLDNNLALADHYLKWRLSSNQKNKFNIE